MAPLRRGPAAVRLLGLRVRMPPEELIFISCECCVLSGKVLCLQRNTTKCGTFNEFDREVPRAQRKKNYIYIHTYIHTFYVTVRPRNLKLVFIRTAPFLIRHRTIYQCHIERCKFKLFILLHQAAVDGLLNKYLIIRSLTLLTTNHCTFYSSDLIPSIIKVN